MNDANTKLMKEQVIRLLEIRSSTEYLPKERDSALEQLLRLDKQETLQVLLSIVSDQNYPDSEVRYRAIEGIVNLEPERGSKFLLPYLNDPDPIIRSQVCGQLYNYGYLYHGQCEEAILPLTNTLRNDPDVSVRLIAAHALGKLGDKRAIPMLRWSQEHDDGKDWEGRSVKYAATEVIEEILSRKSHGEDNDK